MFDAPLTGIFGALGIHHETGQPNHPQGRGVIERFWQTVTIPLARRFATYQGRGADRDTLRRVTLEIDRDLRAAQRGEITTLPKRLPTFQEFIEALEIEIEAYNSTHRHRSLPKLDGRNHATPAEYRAARLNGAEPQIPQPQELAALFMPSELRVAKRGEVKFWNGIYFHRDLMLVDGEEVIVRYDIHDASYVLVHKLSGEFIARAELNGNRSDYMPKSLIERLRDERAARQRKLLDSKLAAVDTERRAATLPPQITPEEIARLEQDFERERTASQAAPEDAPIESMDEMDRYNLWKKLHERIAAGEQLNERLSAFYAGFKKAGNIYLQMERDFELGLTERNAHHGVASVPAPKAAAPNQFLRTRPREDTTAWTEEVERAAAARLRKSGPRVMRRGQGAGSIAGRKTQRRVGRVKGGKR
jgi:putative transposase